MKIINSFLFYFSDGLFSCYKLKGTIKGDKTMLSREELEEVIDFTKGLLKLCQSESQYEAVRKHLADLYEELIDNYIVGNKV